MNRADIADDIVAAMKAVDYDVREVNPFKPEHTVAILPSRTPPIVGRLTAFWHAMRGDVLTVFPSASRIPLDQDADSDVNAPTIPR